MLPTERSTGSTTAYSAPTPGRSLAMTLTLKTSLTTLSSICGKSGINCRSTVPCVVFSSQACIGDASTGSSSTSTNLPPAPFRRKNSSQLRTQPIPLGHLLEKELEEKIRTAIETLPHETRQVFELSRYEDMTYDEIAKRLGISVNTVKYHIKNAIRLLYSQLEPYLLLLLLLG